MLLDIPEEVVGSLVRQSKNGNLYPFYANDYTPKEPHFGCYGGKSIGQIITHLNNYIDSGEVHKIIDFQINSDAPNHFVCFYRYL